MAARVYTRLGFILLTLIIGLAVACGASSTATPLPTPTSNLPEADVPGIVDPTDHGWPRSIEGLNGVFEIPEKPQRIVAVSLGHAEIVAALVEPSRIVGLSNFAFQEDYSNIMEIAAQVGTQVTRDAEQIISLESDMVIDSAFSQPEFIQQLEDAGITVVQTHDDTKISGKRNTIRLMAYILGEEERGEKLVQQVDQRLKLVTDTIGTVPEDEKPRVLQLGYLSKWTGGADSTDEDMIIWAGGINVASQEFSGYQEIGDESIVAMNPEIIVMSDVEVRDNNARNTFLNNPALSEVDAIKNERVYPVVSKWQGNLSHWSIRGVEEMAKLFSPEKFAGVEFGPFQSVLD